MASLREYERKRHFDKTPEPKGAVTSSSGGLRFCVQKHDATRLHYDFRLEAGGVLKSWAVPKGPSLDPKEKRLAMQTEDHPLAYGGFEGLIPEGEYGAGPVLLWDEGTWTPEGDAEEGIAKGKIDFVLDGKKLKGRFHLVRLRGREDKPAWLLIKSRDEWARDGVGVEQIGEASVKTGRAIEELDEDPGMPAFVEPELCTLVSEPPAGDEWLHEPKIDGYRLLARKEGERVQLFTRSGLDWSERFPSVLAAVRALAPSTLLLDGEVCVLGEKGTSSFEALQRALSNEAPKSDVVYFAFDLLFAEGVDLRARPLLERKEALALVVRGQTGTLRFVEHERGGGAAFLERMKRGGFEGMVSKKADAPYRSERTRDWRKLRLATHEELVVVGFKPLKSKTGGAGVGALLVAEPVEGALLFRGKVGTGYTDADRGELERLLRPLARASAPLTPRPTVAGVRDVVWVEPRLYVEVEAKEKTRDGRLRQPAFLGVRRDKSSTPKARAELAEARANVDEPDKAFGAAERPDDPDVVEGVRITHPDRVLYAGTDITKLLIAHYVDAVAPLMLPHVVGRPLALVRCPEGIGFEGVEHAQDPNPQCFFQKHVMRGMPKPIHWMRVREGSSVNDCLTVHDVAGLVGLVQMGCLEIHCWGAAEDDADHPDRVIFDLDPAAGVDWHRVVDAARAIREAMAEAGVVSFVKTTGGKGLHVVIPIEPGPSWDEVKAWSKAVAETFEREAPDLYTTNMRKAVRGGRVFIDYLRNGRGATAIAPYSMRARPGAPVAVPVRWDELDDLHPAQWSVLTLHERIEAAGDAWHDYFDVHQRLPSLHRGGAVHATR